MRYVLLWLFIFLCLAEGRAAPKACDLHLLASSPFEYESAITLVQITSVSKKDFIERLCSRYEMFAQQIIDERTSERDRDVARFFLKTYGDRLRIILSVNPDEFLIKSVITVYEYLED